VSKSAHALLAVILRDYIVICPPVNPQCATARLRLAGGLSLVLAQNSALKREKVKFHAKEKQTPYLEMA
jgi:hypothetical protein